MKLKEFEQQMRLDDMNVKTRQEYIRTVKQFLNFTNEITNDSVNKFFIDLLDKNRSNNTINTYKQILAYYCKFLGLDIKLPKTRKQDKGVKKIKYITEEEMLNDILPLFEMEFKNAEKYILLFKVLFYTGLRKSELVNIPRSAFDFENNMITVTGKGNKTRQIPILKEIRPDLIYYFSTEIEQNGAFNINKSTLSSMFTRIQKNIKWIFPIHAHILRHSFAKFMVKEGANPYQLQKMLGHSEAETTQIYAEQDNEKVVKDILEMFKRRKK